MPARGKTDCPINLVARTTRVLQWRARAGRVAHDREPGQHQEMHLPGVAGPVRPLQPTQPLIGALPARASLAGLPEVPERSLSASPLA